MVFSETKKNWFLIAGLIAILTADMAFGSSGASEKFNEVTSVTTDALSAGQKTGQGILKTIIGWLPLVVGLIGSVGMAMTKYDEVKQERKGTLMVIFWAFVGGFAGGIGGFGLVYILGLLTMGGSEALDAVGTYWTGS